MPLRIIEPMARSDPQRVRHATFVGAATGLRDQLAMADPEVVDAQRIALPRAWEFIDRLAELAQSGG
ncbi:hypothetical protein BH10ACT1_BH10ACT1_22340 [soil metagenome]